MEMDLGAELSSLVRHIVKIKLHKKGNLGISENTRQNSLVQLAYDVLFELKLRTSLALTTGAAQNSTDSEPPVPIPDAGIIASTPSESASKRNLYYLFIVNYLQITNWYEKICNRFDALKKELLDPTSQRCNKEALDEVGDVILSMYGAGIDSVEQIQGCFHTVASMLTSCRIPEAILQRETKKCQEHLLLLASQKGRSPKKSKICTGKEILTFFTQGPLLEAVIPERWWSTSSTPTTPAAIQVHRIALQAQPALIGIEYSVPWEAEGKTRLRTIHLTAASTKDKDKKSSSASSALQNYLTSNPSAITNLKKKLMRSYGKYLLSENQCTQALLRLQKLMKEEETQSPTSSKGKNVASSNYSSKQPGVYRGGPPGDGDVGATNAKTSSSSSSSSGVQKADLGLLYRDPEKALKDVDLQDADEATVKEFKEKMNDTMLANVVKPGDSGYKYDVRVEAKPTGKSNWDSDDDD